MTIEDACASDQAEVAARIQLVVGRLNRRIHIKDHEPIPPSQLSALITVQQHGPLRLSEIAKHEAVTVPTMSRVLTALVDHGLVTRSSDPNDGRCVRIALSDKGAARLLEVRSHRTALMARRLRNIDDQQRATLVEALPALEALLVDD
jgi:DNA-binding MarR family transcriptional regulator